MRNSTLNSLDEVYDIIKRPPEQESVKILPPLSQHFFNALNAAFYEPLYKDEYKDTLKALRDTCQKKKVN